MGTTQAIDYKQDDIAAGGERVESSRPSRLRSDEFSGC